MSFSIDCVNRRNYVFLEGTYLYFSVNWFFFFLLLFCPKNVLPLCIFVLLRVVVSSPVVLNPDVTLRENIGN